VRDGGNLKKDRRKKAVLEGNSPEWQLRPSKKGKGKSKKDNLGMKYDLILRRYYCHLYPKNQPIISKN